MLKNLTLSMFISCVRPVVGSSTNSAYFVGLFTGFLPTTKARVCKWVGLYNFYPPAYTMVIPTHFWQYSPVTINFSTLSTPPIMSNNYVNEIRKGRFWL